MQTYPCKVRVITSCSLSVETVCPLMLQNEAFQRNLKLVDMLRDLVLDDVSPD